MNVDVNTLAALKDDTLLMLFSFVLHTLISNCLFCCCNWRAVVKLITFSIHSDFLHFFFPSQPPSKCFPACWPTTSSFTWWGRATSCSLIGLFCWHAPSAPPSNQHVWSLGGFTGEEKCAYVCSWSWDLQQTEHLLFGTTQSKWIKWIFDIPKHEYKYVFGVSDLFHKHDHNSWLQCTAGVRLG